MKQAVEKRKPSGIVDYVALALTTVGVGYIPGAPGTYGSVVGVGIYVFAEMVLRPFPSSPCFGFLCVDAGYVVAWRGALVAAALLLFCLAGIWASGRSIPLLGSEDPSEAVVDEVMGQLI